MTLYDPRLNDAQYVFSLQCYSDNDELNHAILLCNNRSGAQQDSGAIRVTLQKRPNGEEDLMERGHCVMLVDYVS